MTPARKTAPRLGIDIGATNMRLALVDGAGTILAGRTCPLAGRSPEDVAVRLREEASKVVTSAGIGLRRVASVGIGLAAQLAPAPGRVRLAPNLGWRDVDFGSIASDALGLPVVLLNDLDAIAAGEANFGAGRGHGVVLAVYAGSGIGGGLAVDGRPYQGAGRVALEIGHVKVAGFSALCGCGQRGCLESELGGVNLSMRLRRLARRSWPALLEAAGGNAEAINPGHVEVLFEEGDVRAEKLWQRLSVALGDVLANAITLLNPDCLVLGGTVLRRCRNLRLLAVERLRERALRVSLDGLRITMGKLGQMAGCLGAATAASDT